ncbi:hypothetical protein WJX74_005731 [Apatococcus lobatus]|uniref:Uncharacterized protein n=1 Tax=Apatococcus lobatus TaxID=904363 RepID=A0AAW1SAS1_9CHLO
MGWVPVLAVSVTVLANLACWAGNHKSWLHSWSGLPCLYCVSNKSQLRPAEYWAFDQLDPFHLSSSVWISRKGVAIWRIISIIFFIAASVVEGTTGDGFGDRPAEWITFFTNWTWVLFGVWTVLGTYVTIRHLQEEANQEYGTALGTTATEAQLPKRAWRGSEIAYSLISQTTASSTLFLSAFFWLLLHRKGPVAYDNALKHGVNNIIVIVDTMTSRLQLVSYHFQVVLWYGTGYLLFMWIYHDASSHWVYDVLDWTKPWAIPLYLPLPLLLYAAFMFWFAMAALREYLGGCSRAHGYQMQASSDCQPAENRRIRRRVWGRPAAYFGEDRHQMKWTSWPCSEVESMSRPSSFRQEVVDLEVWGGSVQTGVLLMTTTLLEP